MKWGLIKAIFILPGTVLVFIPSVILFFSQETPFIPDLQYPNEVTFLFAVAFFGVGGYLAINTAALFTLFGRGTPAPWEPPQKLVIAGPYRYVRNPMIIGVIFMLIGETILFNSWPLFMWTILFLAGQMAYLPLVEEKALIKRFGDPYSMYMMAVPRWIPSFRCWEG